ncbi:hypothetical protein [Ruegeria faecimaris]|uniref:hypothetical protein n=1 Tax=Ruegeria faecimaris TaxID=686389 RepID=UPI00232BC8F5|nr:hypothetical protein [Ruegeria faecimaris]
MKNVFTLAIAACLILGSALVAEAKDIKKEQDFLNAVAGKKLVDGGTWVLISPDGKISGQTSDKVKFSGAWIWNKRFWCRTLVVGGNQIPQDCQKVTIEGNQVTFTRNKGKGDSGGTYTITN